MGLDPLSSAFDLADSPLTGGSATQGPTVFGATNITFGSVNFKSDGAGDKGKTTGAADAATEAALASAAGVSSVSLPGWVWGALAGAVVLMVFLFRKK